MAAVVPLISCNHAENVNFDELNSRAFDEYLQPVRPGGVDGSPFWNVFAPKFTYAPAFDFQFADNAASYRFDLYKIDSTFSNPVLPVPSERQSASQLSDSFKSKGEYLLSFTAPSPQVALTEVWGKLPTGNLGVAVTALNSDNEEIGICGAREFLKDYPFNGPYPPAPRDYGKFGLMALDYMSKMPVVQGFRRMGDDLVMPQDVLEYYYNRFGSQNVPYPTLFLMKFATAAIDTEISYAILDPDKADEHIAYARRGAAFLMAQAFPEGSPLAHFPPTYYRDDRTVEVIMSMDPVMAVDTYLNLYDYTKDSMYLEESIRIMETYDRIIDEDGYVPKKLYTATGEGSHDSGALTGGLLLALQRMKNNYGVDRFDGLMSRCEKYMYEYSIPQFDFSGQFEDVAVELEKYQDLTHCTANSYAQYLLRKTDMTDRDLEYARDMARFCEDQFIHWQLLPDGNAVPYCLTPGVYEQYFCAVCIDASNSRMSETFMDLYDRTGDRLYLEKARALVDAIVTSQNVLTGEIPTFWHNGYTSDMFWINCSICSVQVVTRFASYGI